MLGAHIVLHLGLCNAMLRLRPDEQFTAHVRLIDRIDRPHYDQDMHFRRHADPVAIGEFDSPPGEYELQIVAPQYKCSAVDFLFIIDGHNRTITEQMVDGVAQLPHPMLMDGTAPQSFLYLTPTYVLFDKSTQCNKPVPDPLPAHITVENDQDSFYVWMYPDQNLIARAPEIIAMVLQTPTGDNHYIKLKIPFPRPWGGFPDNVQFNITEDAADMLSTQPTGVLLCPKLFETSVG